MTRINTTLAALCAIIIFVLSFGSAYSQEPTQVTEADIHDDFDQDGNYTFDDRANGYNVRGDIQLPREDFGDVDEVYTLIFEPGAQIFFSDENGDAGGSLTIRVNNEDAIGRIQVLGTAVDMVTMDEAVADEGWGGITVLTFPAEDNLISYCEVTNVSDAQPGIQIGTANLVGQCVISSSHIHDNDDNGIQVLSPQNDGSDYSINSNVIHDNGGRGIQIDGGFDGENPELAVVNNVVYDNNNDGIQLHNTEDWISVRNNIVYGNGRSQINLWNAQGNPSVHNNVLDGQDPENVIGIIVLLAWSNQVYNNIIVNCLTGISYAAANGEDFFNCLFEGNGTDFTEGLDAIDCVVEGSADFVDDENGDYHLGPASDAIDEGDDAQGIDLNFTHNDMGAYGGPDSDPEMAGKFFGTVVGGQHHVEVSGTVDQNYLYTVPAGVIMDFDAGTGIDVNGDLNVNGENLQHAVFRGLNNAAWNGVSFGGVGGHNSTLTFADIEDAEFDGINIGATWVNSIDNCSMRFNGRCLG